MNKKLLYSILGAISILPKNLYAAILVKCTGTDCNYDAFKMLFTEFFSLAIKFGIAIIAVAFTYAGFLYLTSAGNSGKISKANTVLKNSVIGILVVLLAYLLVDTLLGTLGFKQEFKISI